VQGAVKRAVAAIGGCGGCSMSLLCADTADFRPAARPPACGCCGTPRCRWPAATRCWRCWTTAARPRRRRRAVRRRRAAARAARHRALPPPGRHGRPMMDWVRELAAVARHVWPSAAAPPGAGSRPAAPTHRRLRPAVRGRPPRRPARRGLSAGRGGLPVINVAGCPTHPGWVIDTLMALAPTPSRRRPGQLAGPRFYADQLVHHGCTRNEYYEFKASADKPSDLGCLMENMGCKGTQAHADCNTRLWNGEGSCTRGGYACISCTEPGFQDPGHPSTRRPSWPASPSACPPTCPRPGSSRWPRCPRARRRSACASNAVADHLVVAPAVKKTHGLK
jgi:hypothetical protein